MARLFDSSSAFPSWVFSRSQYLLHEQHCAEPPVQGKTGKKIFSHYASGDEALSFHSQATFKQLYRIHWVRLFVNLLEVGLWQQSFWELAQPCF